MSIKCKDCKYAMIGSGIIPYEFRSIKYAKCLRFMLNIRFPYRYTICPKFKKKGGEE